MKWGWGVVLLAAGCGGIQAGTTAVTTSVRTMPFTTSFATVPIVLLGPTTEDDGEIVVPRLHAVTTNGFDMAMREQPCADGIHPPETLSWIAEEEGTHTILDTSTNSPASCVMTKVTVSDTWKSVDTTAFMLAAVPHVVVGTLQTINNAEFLAIRLKDVSHTGFQAKFEALGSSGPFADEVMGFVMCPAGIAGLWKNDVNLPFYTSISPPRTHVWETEVWQTVPAPRPVVTLQTANGTGPCVPRYRNLATSSVDLHIDKGLAGCTGSDTTHPTEERMGLFAISLVTPPTATPSQPPTVSPAAAVPTQSPTRSPAVPAVPTISPSAAPTKAPSAAPSVSPVKPKVPTAGPAVPTRGPSAPPTRPPTVGPSESPKYPPTRAPSTAPKAGPTSSPAAPSRAPSAGPSSSPASPTRSPRVLAVLPTASPSGAPTIGPAAAGTPTAGPRVPPTASPSTPPTGTPTTLPSVTPTVSPAAPPTVSPSVGPTASPRRAPSMAPTVAPTKGPRAPGTPTASPRVPPTAAPSHSPTTAPQAAPTAAPTTPPQAAPTKAPTAGPQAAGTPTAGPRPPPTATPSQPPTTAPQAAPTASPTAGPLGAPTAGPRRQPTAAPSRSPTAAPQAAPTKSPTAAPQAVGTPTAGPRRQPTAAPSRPPTAAPSAAPTGSPARPPSAGPSQSPSLPPTAAPTGSPRLPPTGSPTAAPTAGPTKSPRTAPSRAPSRAPSAAPAAPTAAPRRDPSAAPSASPTPPAPSVPPTGVPTRGPTALPSAAPSGSAPSLFPSRPPSGAPSAAPVAPTAPPAPPSAPPSRPPSATPTAPTRVPSAAPGPTTSPSSAPSVSPSKATPPIASEGIEVVAEVGSVGAAAALSAPAAAQGGRLVLLLAGCDGLLDELPPTLHPTGVRMDAFTLPAYGGCVVVNAGIAAGITLMHFVSSLVVARVLGKTSGEAQAMLRFPSFSFLAWMVLWTGPSYAGANMLREAAHAGDVIVGLIPIAVGVVLPVWLLREGRKAQPEAAFKLDPGTRSGLSRSWLGSGEWLSLTAAMKVERWGVAFRAALPGKHHVLAVDLFLNEFAALSSGFGPKSCTSCGTLRVIDACAAVVLIGCVLRWRPYCRPARLSITVLAQALLAGGAACLAAGWFSSDCEKGIRPLPGTDPASMLLGAGAVVLLLAVALDVTAVLRGVQLGRRDGLRNQLNEYRKSKVVGGGETLDRSSLLRQFQQKYHVDEKKFNGLWHDACGGEKMPLQDFLAREEAFWDAAVSGGAITLKPQLSDTSRMLMWTDMANDIGHPESPLRPRTDAELSEDLSNKTAGSGVLVDWVSSPRSTKAGQPLTPEGGAARKSHPRYQSGPRAQSLVRPHVARLNNTTGGQRAYRVRSDKPAVSKSFMELEDSPSLEPLSPMTPQPKTEERPSRRRRVKQGLPAADSTQSLKHGGDVMRRSVILPPPIARATTPHTPLRRVARKASAPEK